MCKTRKSDSPIVVVKRANNGAQAPAEPVERRGETKRNPNRVNAPRTLRRNSVAQASERVRQAARRNPKEPLTALLHHVSPDSLRVAYEGLRKSASAGVDGMTWEGVGEGLEERLLDLHRRIHRGSYRAPPVRRVEIPKPDGGTRPLGIGCLEDKIVQKAVVDAILTPIYEVEFLGFNYGFRPGRGAHDALDALAYGIQRRKVNWVVDADIRGFFDTVDRSWLIRFLEHRIGDRRVIRLIAKWLDAGVMDHDQWTDTGTGTPQGAIASPVLANVYLHYVLDNWFHRKWRKEVPEGEALIVRYADDFVVGFQYKREAELFLKDLKERLCKFGLSLHPQKTRLVEFGRFAQADRAERGERRPETFDFLGFTHYCMKTRKGRFRLGRKPMRARRIRTLHRIKEALRKRMHHDRWEVGAWLGKVVNGWLGYYSVPGSRWSCRNFVQRVFVLWMKTVRRRSQRHKLSWERMRGMAAVLWPPVKVRHPWPEQRFAVKYSR